MKISNSKKELAKIISENDGWIEWRGRECPVERGTLVDVKYANGLINIGVSALTDKYDADHTQGTATSFTAANWNFSMPISGIRSYRLHKPEKSLEELCGEVKEENKHEHVDSNPTIEQLAADYRNAKDYADRKQQEADAAKADAKAKLAELVAAGEALRLTLSVTGAESEPEMAITNWWDLQVDDLIWYGGDDELSSGEYRVMRIEAPDYEGYRTVRVNGNNGDHWIDTRAGWGFIRRP